jgi:hypothetical protein
MKAGADDGRRADGEGGCAAFACPFRDRVPCAAGDFLDPSCIDDVENKWLARREAAPFLRGCSSGCYALRCFGRTYSAYDVRFRRPP